MSGKAAITVHRSREEVERLWQSSEYRPAYIDRTDAAVTFVDAPGDRGTEIHVALNKRALGGKLGEIVQKLVGSEPRAKVGDDLRRFKQHVETGVIARSEGTPEGELVERKLGQAADAFERDHLPDALRILRPLSREAPNVAAVRELTGLALYGTGQWAAAAKELEAFRSLTSSVEQHPVLADCYRALKRYPKVVELWDELREASPGAALVTEGRIVAAGALADQGDVKGAIRLLERGPVRPTGRTGIHHLRLWYALADLYERAGDAPRARDLFARVVAVEPALADAAERLAALG